MWVRLEKVESTLKKTGSFQLQSVFFLGVLFFSTYLKSVKTSKIVTKSYFFFFFWLSTNNLSISQLSCFGSSLPGFICLSQGNVGPAAAFLTKPCFCLSKLTSTTASCFDGLCFYFFLASP